MYNTNSTFARQWLKTTQLEGRVTGDSDITSCRMGEGIDGFELKMTQADHVERSDSVSEHTHF